MEQGRYVVSEEMFTILNIGDFPGSSVVSGLEVVILDKSRVEENDRIKLFILEMLNIFSDTLIIPGTRLQTRHNISALRQLTYLTYFLLCGEIKVNTCSLNDGEAWPSGTFLWSSG